MNTFFYIVIAFLLVLLNGFFVAAEFGMVKIRFTRIEVIKKTYGLRGKILSDVHQQLDAYLSACQLGITLASLALGWIGEPAFATLLEPFLASLGFGQWFTVHALSIIFAFILITFLHIVIGELMPKSIAIRQSESVSLWTAVPLYIFYWVMFPVIWLMNSSANLLLKLIRMPELKASDYFSNEELRLIVSGSYVHGKLAKEERKILKHTLDLAELKVTDVMRPTEDMVMIDLKQSNAEILKTIRDYHYSRYPVCEGGAKQIIGIVHIKDVFTAYYRDKDNLDFKRIIRPVLKVSRRLPLLELLRKFREGMPHFALIYTGKEENLIGFVTLDNLLHILVGRIKDEFHRTRDDWMINKDGSFTMRGNASIYTLERALDIDIEEEDIDDDIDTISGLIVSQIEAIPKTGQTIYFKQFSIRIKKMRGPKVLQVIVMQKELKKS